MIAFWIRKRKTLNRNFALSFVDIFNKLRTICRVGRKTDYSFWGHLFFNCIYHRLTSRMISIRDANCVRINNKLLLFILTIKIIHELCSIAYSLMKSIHYFINKIKIQPKHHPFKLAKPELYLSH